MLNLVLTKYYWFFFNFNFEIICCSARSTPEKNMIGVVLYCWKLLRTNHLSIYLFLEWPWARDVNNYLQNAGSFVPYFYFVEMKDKFFQILCFIVACIISLYRRVHMSLIVLLFLFWILQVFFFFFCPLSQSELLVSLDVWHSFLHCHLNVHILIFSYKTA